MYQIGLSSSGFQLNEENFKMLKENGIDAIEISMQAKLYQGINYQEIKKLSDQYNVELWSYHLPFSPFKEIEIASLDKGIRDHTITYFSELIKKGSSIGIDKFIIHPSGEPINDSERAEKMKYSMQSLTVLAEVAFENGALIAVEDLPRTCLGNTADEIQILISANDKLRVCFDTNHMLIDNNIDFIKKIADKIVTVHISDFDFINERHWLPGEGSIDWNSIYTALKEVGYDGVWMYELNLAAPDTIVRDRDLTFHDFVENANSIFAGEKPPILGKPKENLGMWK